MYKSSKVSASYYWEEQYQKDQALFTGFLQKLHDE